jgi:DNA-binding NarL/FixJ family response regulator
MKKIILLYGSALAFLVYFLKVVQYKYLIHDFSIEFYVGLVALFFTGLGVWMGFRFTSQQKNSSLKIITLKQRQQFDISKREFEVLKLIDQGLSNQEIADKLFVSLNTVKTHTSNLFSKLDAKRRTQAVQRAKDLGLIS